MAIVSAQTPTFPGDLALTQANHHSTAEADQGDPLVAHPHPARRVECCGASSAGDLLSQFAESAGKAAKAWRLLRARMLRASTTRENAIAA